MRRGGKIQDRPAATLGGSGMDGGNELMPRFYFSFAEVTAGQGSMLLLLPSEVFISSLLDSGLRTYFWGTYVPVNMRWDEGK